MVVTGKAIGDHVVFPGEPLGVEAGVGVDDKTGDGAGGGEFGGGVRVRFVGWLEV